MTSVSCRFHRPHITVFQLNAAGAVSGRVTNPAMFTNDRIEEMSATTSVED